MNKDITSKKIIKRLIKTISSLFFNLETQNIELIDKEFERIESKRADILALLDNNKILHLEIQTSYDKKMPLRMLRYYTDIKLFYDLPILQSVIYLGKGNLKSELKDIGLKYSYNLIDMKKIDCELFLNQNSPEAVVLSILCDFKDKNELDVVKYILEKLKVLTNEKEFKEFMVILEEFSTLRDLKPTLKEAEMLLLDRVKYEDLPSYEIGLEKGMEKGMEKGIEKGMEKGIEKGILGLYKYEKNINLIAKELGVNKEKVLYVLEKNGIKVKNG